MQENNILSQSDCWDALINHAKEKKSYYSKLPIKIEKQKTKSLVCELASEFKKEENTGYNLREIIYPISNITVRILWPIEEEEVAFLEK